MSERTKNLLDAEGPGDVSFISVAVARPYVELVCVPEDHGRANYVSWVEALRVAAALVAAARELRELPSLTAEELAVCELEAK